MLVNLLSYPYLIESYVLNVTSSNYYNYLLAYATYFNDLEIFYYKSNDTLTTELFAQEFIPLIQLLTFKNIVRYGVKVFLENFLTYKALGVLTKFCSLHEEEESSPSNIRFRDFRYL
jgi:hypothetical protein